MFAPARCAGGLAIAAFGLGAHIAHADGEVIAGGSPRAIGRAGTGTVADDGGGALLIDPAALARRSETRVQIGVGFDGDDLAWQPATAGGSRVRNLAAATPMPLIAIELAVGDWVIGAGAMTAAASSRTLATPTPAATAYGEQFAYRYAGLVGAIRRDTLAIGAARRLGDELAVGCAIAASRVAVSETRDVWAGFAGVHAVGDPRDDATIAITASDDFAPSAVCGAMLVPADTSVELAVSAGWEHSAQLSGGVGGGPSVLLASARAQMTLEQPYTVRAGARYVRDRWNAELDGDLWVLPSADDNVWQLTGVGVAGADGERTAPIAALRSRLAPISHGAVRGSLDVALVPGFLWATAGYAFTGRGTRGGELSPTLADLGGHTIALGLEANAGTFTITFGASRTYARDERVTASVYRLDNPFAAGDASVAVGTYGETIDLVGLIVDAEL